MNIILKPILDWIGKKIGIPGAILIALTGGSIWLTTMHWTVQANAKTGEQNRKEIENTKDEVKENREQIKIVDQRVYQILLGSLAVQTRLGVTEEELKKMAEKAKTMDGPAFRPPPQNSHKSGGG